MSIEQTQLDIQPPISEGQEPSEVSFPQFLYTIDAATGKYFKALYNFGFISAENVEKEWDSFHKDSPLGQSLSFFHEYPSELCQNPAIIPTYLYCTEPNSPFYADLHEPQSDYEIRSNILESARSREAELKTQIDIDDLMPQETYDGKTAHAELAFLHNLILELKETVEEDK